MLAPSGIGTTIPVVTPVQRAVDFLETSPEVQVVGTALGSAAIGSLLSGTGKLAQFANPGGVVAGLVSPLGITFAARGGHMQKGILLWQKPDNSGYNQFKFQMNPDEIEDKGSPNYAKHDIPGQNRPLYQFVSGGSREISFALHFFYADRDRTTTRGYIETLRTLTQRAPEQQAVSQGQFSTSAGPPVLWFFFGNYYRKFRCLMTKFEVKTSDLYDPATLLPMRAQVDITLSEAVDPNAPDAPPVTITDGIGSLTSLVARGGIG